MDTSFQFVLFAKRILREFRALNQTVSAGFLGVQNQVETVAKEQKTKNEREKTPAVVRAELQIPPAVQAQKEARQTRAEWRDKLKIGIETATFVAVFAYAIINYHMLRQIRIEADAAKESADLASKQMEATGAAIVEFSRPIAVQFPVPPYGEVRANLMNSGHVIAYNTTFEFSASLIEPSGSPLREFLSKKESIPGIEPSIVINRPDLIYPFQLSQEEYHLLVGTRAYITIKGNLSYENGFQRTIDEPFCYAYVSGTKIGSWGGTCSEALIMIHMQKDLESKGQKSRQ